MKFFTATCTKRNTAFVALLVWVFALASSVANACFLEADEPHSNAAKSAATTIQARAELADAVATHAGQREDSDGPKESCLKACEDGTHTLPKAYSGVQHADPGPAPWVAALWTASEQVSSAPGRGDDLTAAVFGQPLRVRYSRLAL